MCMGEFDLRIVDVYSFLGSVYWVIVAGYVLHSVPQNSRLQYKRLYKILNGKINTPLVLSGCE